MVAPGKAEDNLLFLPAAINLQVIINTFKSGGADCKDSKV